MKGAGVEFEDEKVIEDILYPTDKFGCEDKITSALEYFSFEENLSLLRELTTNPKHPLRLETGGHGWFQTHGNTNTFYRVVGEVKTKVLEQAKEQEITQAQYDELHELFGYQRGRTQSFWPMTTSQYSLKAAKAAGEVDVIPVPDNVADQMI